MKRIEYIDAIKGFAIILMVMGHVIAWNYSDYESVCVYDFKQLTNIKLGGGDFSTYLFIPHATIFYGIRFPCI